MYKLCPPPFVSQVLLSWHLVDPYMYESIKCLTAKLLKQGYPYHKLS